MKLSSIAKASLALGILTTGVITTNAQSASAETPKQQTKSQEDKAYQTVKKYYTNGYSELHNVNAFRAPKRENVVVVKKDNITTAIQLKGIDKDLYNANLTGVDVFVVNENDPGKKVVKTIGGLSKTNKGPYYDYVGSPVLTLFNGKTNKITTMPYFIYKEQVTLKELDFKIRKVLRQKYDLYEHGPSNGYIRIHMKGDKPNDYYTFQLNKVLEEHRMGIVVDTTKIDRITVNM